jgi:hypothetical protein
MQTFRTFRIRELAGQRTMVAMAARRVAALSGGLADRLASGPMPPGFTALREQLAVLSEEIGVLERLEAEAEAADMGDAA